MYCYYYHYTKPQVVGIFGYILKLQLRLMVKLATTSGICYSWLVSVLDLVCGTADYSIILDLGRVQASLEI